MRRVHHPFRRAQLLSRTSNALAAWALTVAASAGCAMEPGTVYGVAAGEPGAADPFGPAGDRAVEYLATTELELGVDSLAALQIYGAARGRARALEVADARRGDVRPSDLERYGVLLEVDKAPYPPEAIEVSASASPPDPLDDLMDDRVTRCLDEVLVCEVSPTCVEYLELDDRWGYVLTHQAVTLLFAHWVGCDLDLDVDARRQAFAANLVAAMRADPVPSDLAYERLAMLGHLGFSGAFESGWLDAMLEAQQPDGCFPLGPGRECHPHSTGVALWAIAQVVGR